MPHNNSSIKDGWKQPDHQSTSKGKQNEKLPSWSDAYYNNPTKGCDFYSPKCTNEPVPTSQIVIKPIEIKDRIPTQLHNATLSPRNKYSDKPVKENNILPTLEKCNTETAVTKTTAVSSITKKFVHKTTVLADSISTVTVSNCPSTEPCSDSDLAKW